MGNEPTKLDMTMMYAMHGALRRELVQIARVASRTTDDPARQLHTMLGWQLFKKFLHVHHTAEDVTIWPILASAFVDAPDRLAVVGAMEAEHATIDPLLDAIDAAALDRDYGHQRIGDLVDSLVTNLTGHLTHEESDALQLIDQTLTPEQWKFFSEDHKARIGKDAPTYLPWLLDHADADIAAGVLDKMPEQLVAAYHDNWGPAYAQLSIWAVTDEAA
jgi:hemerythrin-like domain-containing protein